MSPHFLNSLCHKIGNAHVKALSSTIFGIRKVPCDWLASWIRPFFFYGTPFLLEVMIDWLTITFQPWLLADIFSKMNKVACQLTVFVANDQIWLSSKNQKFGELLICHCGFDSFLLKDFPEEISSNISACDLFFGCCIMKYVNIWKSHLTQ